MKRDYIEFYAYETYCMIRLEEDMGSRQSQILSRGRAMALHMEQRLSMHDPESELSIWCNQYVPHIPYRISELLFHILKKNLLMASMSGGAFDPAVGSLVKLWKIGSGSERIPGVREVSRARKNSGTDCVELNEEDLTVTIHEPGMMFDFGASGKGYALQRIVEDMKSQGVRSACLDFGGNLYVMGRNEGTPWKIGIRHPNTASDVLTVIEVEHEAVSTSSWYEHCFKKDGQRYSHLLDPVTGQPASSGLESVTVVCSDALYADMLSTSVYILGLKKGKELKERLEQELGMGSRCFAFTDSQEFVSF